MSFRVYQGSYLYYYAFLQLIGFILLPGGIMGIPRTWPLLTKNGLLHSIEHPSAFSNTVGRRLVVDVFGSHFFRLRTLLFQDPQQGIQNFWHELSDIYEAEGVSVIFVVDGNNTVAKEGTHCVRGKKREVVRKEIWRLEKKD